MPTITASGIGSGLDVESLVSQLMEVERIPVQRLESQRSAVEARISAYGTLSSALAGVQSAVQRLNTPVDFLRFDTASSNNDLLTASASSAAEPGTHQVTVHQLAQRHRLLSGAFGDPENDVGSGTLTLAVGSADAFDVSVAAGTTLTELRDAINEAAEAAGVGLTATLVDGQHLVLTADDTGAGNAITVSVSGAAGDLANLVYDPALAPDDPAQLMSQVQAAQDALVDVDGVTGITRAGNTLSDVLEGVTLNLAGADPGQTVDLTVSQDLDTITSAVQDFAEAYNTFLDTVDTLRLGELSGDSTVRNAESLLRGVLNTPAQGLGLSYLSEVGVSFQLTDVERADGTTAKRLEMEVDAGQLGSALSQDPEAVTALFTDTQQGFGARLNTLLGDMLGEGGLIDGRTDGLHAETARIDDRILGMERRLLTTEQGLRREFTTLDALVGSLTATSEFLTQQLASLPGVVNDQSG